MALKGGENGLKGAQNQPKTGPKRKPNKKTVSKKAVNRIRLTAKRRLTAIRLAEAVSG
jgi:hypothetical protein